MFHDASIFNGDISGRDVSSDTNMKGMFFRASVFNGDISSWDVSSVTKIELMFQGARKFSSVISDWDVSNVGIMNPCLGMPITSTQQSVIGM